MTDTQISINVAKAREAMHLTQEEMANVLGISRQAYGNLERGKTSLFNKQLPRIAEVCGIRLDKLCMGYDTDINPQVLQEELKEKTQQLEYSEREREKMQVKMEGMEQMLHSQQEHIDSLKSLTNILNYHLGNREE
ncbi:MAG: helix-turn-helix domain-containing protein [Candidatus Cryptobacteroides sp.]